MPGSNSFEVSAVEGDDGLGLQAFGESDDGGIGASEGPVPVLKDEFAHPAEVAWLRSEDFEARKARKKRGLREGPGFSLDKVGRLRHTQRRYDERETRILQN